MHKGEIPKVNVEYSDNLAKFFEMRQKGFVRYAETLLLEGGFISRVSDVRELARDLSQETFQEALTKQDVDFSRGANSVGAYLTKKIELRVRQYLSKTYNGVYENSKKIPEKRYIELRKLKRKEPIAQAIRELNDYEKEELTKAIKTLDYFEQRVVQMHFYENKSFQQIANELALARPIIERRCNSALRKLKSIESLKEIFRT